MKTCRCIPRRNMSRIPVVIRKCRQLTTITDNRLEICDADKDAVLQHPAYACENGKELAELLKIIVNNYYESA